jgi:hypothetical protein
MVSFFIISAGLTPIGGLTHNLLPWPVTDALFLPLIGLTASYLVRHTGRSGNDLAKIAFVLGVMVIFVPMDVILELGGDFGVLIFTATIIGLLVWLRQRIKQPAKANTFTPHCDR